ncbi:hypothetical protein BLAT2472_10939 [Burkholderia latens]
MRLESTILVRERWLRYDRPLVASTNRPCGRRPRASMPALAPGGLGRSQAAGTGANAPARVGCEAWGRRRPPGGFRIQQQWSVRAQSGADRTSRGTT